MSCLTGRHVAILSLALFLTMGAALRGATTTDAQRTLDTPVRGGTLRIGYSTNMATFDPTQAFYDDWWVMNGTLFNGLYQVDGRGHPQLDLAAAPPVVSPDRKVWTFHLRKGVVFHNGTEATADD